MADILSTVSLVSFILSGVALVLAILFFILFRIPSVIGDLSGRTARKSIAKMRVANEKTGVKSYKESKTNVERGKLTGTMPDSGKPNKKNTVPVDGQPETGLLADNKAEGLESEATGVLDEETGMLESETTGLLVDENATAPLDTPAQKPVVRSGGKKIVMLEEVMFIHTEEVI